VSQSQSRRMAMGQTLKEVKNNLQDALGSEDFSRYLKLLKKWFSQSLTKEQFDTHARKLIPPEKIHFHNAFFVALLSKCNLQYSSPPLNPGISNASSSSSSSAPPSNKRKGIHALKQIINRSRGPEKRFRVSEPIQTVQPSKPIRIVQEAPSPISDDLTFCVKDGLLPDRSTMFGRALVIAWEYGVEEIEERSVELLVLATKDLLKNVLHTAVQLRRNYVLSNSGFPHLFGVDPSLTTASNTSMRSITQSCYGSNPGVMASRSKPVGQICLRDVYDGLKLRPDVLPCQTVSSVVLERILCKLDEKPDPSYKSDV